MLHWAIWHQCLSFKYASYRHLSGTEKWWGIKKSYLRCVSKETTTSIFRDPFTHQFPLNCLSFHHTYEQTHFLTLCVHAIMCPKCSTDLLTHCLLWTLQFKRSNQCKIRHQQYDKNWTAMKFLESLSVLIKTITVDFHLCTWNQEVKCLIKSQLILRNNKPNKTYKFSTE